MLESTVRHFLVRLKLLAMGEADTEKEVCDLVVAPVIFVDKEGREDAAFLDTSRDVEATLRRCEERYAAFARNPHRSAADSHSRALQQEVVEEFYR